MSTGAAPLAAPATLMSLVWPARSALRAAVLMIAGATLLAALRQGAGAVLSRSR